MSEKYQIPFCTVTNIQFKPQAQTEQNYVSFKNKNSPIREKESYNSFNHQLKTFFPKNYKNPKQ